MASAFTRYIGVDYSCAQTPEASLNGLRVYCANGGFATEEVKAFGRVNPPQPSIDTPFENRQPKACCVGSCSPIGLP